MENIYEYIVTNKDGEQSAGVIKADNEKDAKERIAKMQECSQEKVNVIPVQFDSNGIFEVMTKRVVTIEDVAAVAIKSFIESCIEEASKNFTESQVENLSKLFGCVQMGCEYKCVGCQYNHQIPDYPSHPYDCFFELYREEDEERMPCEDE